MVLLPRELLHYERNRWACVPQYMQGNPPQQSLSSCLNQVLYLFILLSLFDRLSSFAMCLSTTPPFPLLFLYHFPFPAITHDYPTFSKGLTAFDTPPNHYHSCSNHAMVDDRSPSSRIIGVTVCIDGRLWLVSSLYLDLIFYRPGLARATTRMRKATNIVYKK